MTEKTVRLDIMSDPICPWCYIGKRRFAEGLEMVQQEYDVDFEITWQGCPGSLLDGNSGVDVDNTRMRTGA